MNNSNQCLDKVLPHNLEAEQSILGGILLDNSYINSALTILSKADFYDEANRKIFSAIIEFAEKDQPFNLGTLTDALKDKGLLDSVGGTFYLSSLAANKSSAVNFSKNLEIVKNSSDLRKLIRVAEKIIDDSKVKNADVDEVLNKAEHSIFEISENKVRPSFYAVRDIVKDSFQSIKDIYARKELITGVATGFEYFDDLTAGLQPSDLIIIAGRPSMGKTSFALNIAQFVAVECQTPVAFFSLDHSKEQLAFRLLASESKIDSQRLRKGFLGETDWPKLTAASGHFLEAPLYIDDTPSIKLLEMTAKSRRLKTDVGLGLIVVDYMQLMQVGNHEHQMLEICRSLKALAKEVKVPIIALYQLGYKSEDNCNRHPQIADLQETTPFERYADVIVFIHRDDVYNKSNDKPKKSTAEIIIAKQKNGPTGTFDLAFMKEVVCFANLADNEPTSRIMN